MKKDLLHKLPGRAFAFMIVCFFLLYQLDAKDEGYTERMKLNMPIIQSPSIEVNSISIPFLLVGRLIFVQARVDTFFGNFLVDTGSEKLILNQEYFRQHNGKKVYTTGNTGEVETAYLRQVDTLHLGAFNISNLQAHVVDITHIEQSKKIKIIGILGYDVFKDFTIFFDFQNSRIVLNRLDKNGRIDNLFQQTEKPFDSLKFTLNKYLIIVKGSVNNIPLRLILDSGAELNLMDKQINRKVLENFTVIKNVAMVGVGKNKVDTQSGMLKEVKFGNQEGSNMRTLLASMEDINSANNMTVDGVIGYEFFNRRRVMINYKNSMLYFFGPRMEVNVQ
jgi:hypothetical protein